MNKIYTLDDKLDVEEIELEHPSSLQGGSYFTRMTLHSSPVYIQTNPCSTKSGIVKTAKKSYCDLMFNSHDDKTIQWFEDLERRCIDAIFQKKDLWFHNEMELDDIETAFSSPIRLYKSGKNYLIRCNIANTSLSSGTFKCYDEHTNPVSLDKLENPSIKIIPLLEVQGVKFTSKNFSLELALKQIMIIEDPDFMNECFIQPGNIKSIRQKDIVEEPIVEPMDTLVEKEELATAQEVKQEAGSNTPLESHHSPKSQEQLDNEEHLEAQEQLNSEKQPETQEQLDNEEHLEAQESPEAQEQLEAQELPETQEQSISQELSEAQEQPEAQELSEESLGNSSPTLLDEVTLDYHNLGNEEVKLKSPEEVYYDLWYEARARAKLAREEAIKAYLEAKNIKNLYMLDNFSDSEDEFEEYLEE